MTYQPKITFGEMRASGVRDVLIYRPITATTRMRQPALRRKREGVPDHSVSRWRSATNLPRVAILIYHRPMTLGSAFRC
jgi:hypothetical protein